MKKSFLKALYLGIVLGIAGLAGCQNPFEPIHKAAPQSQGKGRVVITVGDAATARTIAPAGTISTRYTLTFDGPAPVDQIEVTGASVEREVELVVGNWTITATGYTGTAGNYVAIAEGSVATTVADGATSPLNILLGPKTGGAVGTFSYSLKIPNGLDSAQLIISTPNGVVAQTIPLTYSAAEISARATLNPGEYLARIRLAKDGLFAGLTEALHIYSGLTSALPHQDYTDADFQAAVSGGFDLTSLIPAPVSWAKPAATLADQAQYTGTVEWKTKAGATFTGNFGEAAEYQAIVTLTAKPGYTFTGIVTNSFTYTGAAVTNVADSGIVTITFPATAAAPSEPSTNAQHLAMLQSLGVNTTPDLPVAPNGQPYNPQTSSSPSASWARAASSDSGPSLGPLGKIYSQPLREIFVVGYQDISVGGSSSDKDHALFQDFSNKSSLTILGQDSKNDSGWAKGTDSQDLLRKSVAADLDGDGIDEVVIVTLVRATNKILINKGEYKNNAFTVTQIGEAYNTPNEAVELIPLKQEDLSVSLSIVLCK